MDYHSIWQSNYEFMRTIGFEEVDGLDFYLDIFPHNEVTGELNSHYQKPNAIYLYQKEPDNKKLKRRIMLADTWEEDYLSYIAENGMTLCSGLSYRGWANKLENAQNMNALVIDIDGVTTECLGTLLYRCETEFIPTPTYIVLSGTGVHIYYVLKKPIPLFPYLKQQLKAVKNYFTARIWDYKYTSMVKAVQYQSINQGFRMVGSINSKYGTKVVAFRTGDKVDINYLNKFILQDDLKIQLEYLYGPTQFSKEEAAELFPEWYERVVVHGDKKRKKWDIAGKVNGSDPYALYHWWLKRAGEIMGGHRYFFMMNLAIYACKCDVSKKQLKQDLYEVYEVLSKVEHRNVDGSADVLSEYDIKAAMEAYDRAYFCWKIEDVESTSGLKIQRNKRNGRTQEEHMAVMRAVQSVVNPNWREGNGRKSKQDIIREWQINHPTGKKVACIKDTQLSKPTVYKWWDDSISSSVNLCVNDTVIEVKSSDINQSANTLLKSKLEAYYDGLNESQNNGENG